MNIRSAILRFCCAVVLASALFHAFGQSYATLFLRPAQNIVNRHYQDIVSRKSYFDEDNRLVFEVLTPREHKAASKQFSASLLYICPIIALSLVIAFPSPPRTRLLACGLVAVMAYFCTLAEVIVASVTQPLTWKYLTGPERFFHGFISRGGRPFMAVGIAVLSLALAGGVTDFFGSGNAMVRRNAPCPCGSGKKYKRCCGSKETGRSGRE